MSGINTRTCCCSPACYVIYTWKAVCSETEACPNWTLVSAVASSSPPEVSGVIDACNGITYAQIPQGEYATCEEAVAAHIAANPDPSPPSVSADPDQCRYTYSLRLSLAWTKTVYTIFGGVTSVCPALGGSYSGTADISVPIICCAGTQVSGEYSAGVWESLTAAFGSPGSGAGEWRITGGCPGGIASAEVKSPTGTWHAVPIGGSATPTESNTATLTGYGAQVCDAGPPLDMRNYVPGDQIRTDYAITASVEVLASTAPLCMDEEGNPFP
jgi:hypothetical protein